jgi:hypothetical protein
MKIKVYGRNIILHARGSLEHFKPFPGPLQDHRRPTLKSFRATIRLDELGPSPLSYDLQKHNDKPSVDDLL